MAFIVGAYLAVGLTIVGAVLFDDIRTGWLPLSDWPTLRFWATIGVYALMVFLWPVAVVKAITLRGRK